MEIINRFKEEVEKFRLFTEKTEGALVQTRASFYNQNVANFRQATNQKIAIAREQRDFEIANIRQVRDERVRHHEEEIRRLNSLLTNTRIQNRDDEDIQNINALIDRLKYEHDETNRFHLERLIERAQKEFNERKQIEAISEEIAMHREQISIVRENAQAEIDMIRQNYEFKINTIRMIAEEQAEANRQNERNLKESQQRSIRTTESFRNRYKELGFSLGEAFGAGFLTHLNILEQRLLNLSAGLNMANSSVSNVFNTRNLGGITQNFYSGEQTPHEARLMAEEILRKVL